MGRRSLPRSLVRVAALRASRCLFAAKEGRQDHRISVGARAGSVACGTGVAYGTVSCACTFSALGRGVAQAASPKDPVRGLCQTLQGDCVMRTVLSSDWRAPSMAGCLLGLVLIAAATPAAAQGTPEQRAACEQDAYRLCSQYIPDERRTGNCLRRNRISLSPACRRLFSGRGRR
jgi:hypothetical protein